MKILISIDERTGQIDRLHVGTSGPTPIAYEHQVTTPGAPGSPPSTAVGPVPAHVTDTVTWARTLINGARAAHVRIQLLEHAGVPADKVAEVEAAIEAARGPRGNGGGNGGGNRPTGGGS